VHEWKLKEEKTWEEYKSIVKDRVVEAEWKYPKLQDRVPSKGLRERD